MPKTKETVLKTERTSVDSSPSKGKKKKKKDPNKPKTPQSAFLFFSSAKRNEVTKTHPGIKFQEVAKILGEMWKGITEADKKPYEQQAQRDRLRYKEEMEHYKPPPAIDSSDDDKKSKKRKRRKDPNEPKGAPSAYILYANSIREDIKKENPDAQFTDTGRIIGQKWKQLTEEQRKPFNEESEKLRVQATKKKLEYKKAHPESFDKDAPPAKRAKKEKKTADIVTTTTTTLTTTTVQKVAPAEDDESDGDEDIKKKDDKDDEDEEDEEDNKEDEDDDDDEDDNKEDKS